MDSLGQEAAWMVGTLLSVLVFAVGLLTATWALMIPAGIMVLISHRHWMK
jgi:hypothetical protein